MPITTTSLATLSVDDGDSAKEEDVNDEPEARLGRLSETGRQFGTQRLDLQITEGTFDNEE